MPPGSTRHTRLTRKCIFIVLEHMFDCQAFRRISRNFLAHNKTGTSAHPALDSNAPEPFATSRDLLTDEVSSRRGSSTPPAPPDDRDGAESRGRRGDTGGGQDRRLRWVRFGTRSRVGSLSDMVVRADSES
jgi:hypothetical protein